MKKIFLILTIIIVIGCDPITKKLLLINNVNEKKYYLLLLDTASLNKNITKVVFGKLNSNDSVWPTLVSGKGKNFWENYINRYSKDSTLYIYFFNTNQITDSIINERRYKRFDLKVKDLDSLHWILKYE
jgi:hypothetical protein